MKNIFNIKGTWSLRSLLQMMLAVLVLSSLLLEFVQMYNPDNASALIELAEDFEEEKETEPEEQEKELDEFLSLHGFEVSFVHGFELEFLYFCSIPSSPFREIQLPPPIQA